MDNFVRLSSFIVFIMSWAVLQSCTPLGETGNANNVKTYDQSYEEMVEIVERSIRGSNFNIAYVDDSESDLITMIVNRESYIGNQAVQDDQGRVRVRKIDQNQTQVEIENPSYHFSVPDNQKIDYQRIIFNRIGNLIQ